MPEIPKSPLATAADVRSAGSRVARRFRTLDPLPVNRLVFRCRSLTERELARLLDRIARRPKNQRSNVSANGLIFAATLVDADGNQILSDADVGSFEEWDSADCQVLYDQVARHVGIRDSDLDKLAEDAAKNSDATAGDSPRCASPSG